MKTKTAHGIPMYLKLSQGLYEALEKDFAVKDNLFKSFKLDMPRLEKSFALLDQAKGAQVTYELITANETETRVIFEDWYERAIHQFRKHSALLKGALKHNPEKLLALGIIGKEEEKTSFEWLNKALAFYVQLLDDEQLIALMAKYNLEQYDFENVKTMITNSLNAYLAMTNDRPEVKVAITNRDKAFMALSDDVSEIQGLVWVIFEQDPGVLKKYNLPIEYDEIGQEISLTMVKDSSITSTIGGKKEKKEKES